LGKHPEGAVRNIEVDVKDEWLKTPKKPADLEKLNA
jgi:hypothetical protein